MLSNHTEAVDKEQTTTQPPASSLNQRTFDLRARKQSKTLTGDKNGAQASPAPRKKFEKLNSKSGIDILDIYKLKYAKKFADQELLADVINSPQSPDTKHVTSKFKPVLNNILAISDGNNEQEKRILECEKENETNIMDTDDQKSLISESVKPVLEMKISKKKKIVFV